MRSASHVLSIGCNEGVRFSLSHQRRRFLRIVIRALEPQTLHWRSAAVLGCGFGRRPAARARDERDARRTRRREACATAWFRGRGGMRAVFSTDLVPSDDSPPNGGMEPTRLVRHDKVKRVLT